MSRLAMWRRRSTLPWRWKVIVDGIAMDFAMTRRAALRRRGVPVVWATVVRTTRPATTTTRRAS